MAGKFIKIILLTSVFILVSCSKPVKTYDHFKQHPKDIQTEAKRCLEDEKNGKQIGKDQTCMNAITVESERCIEHKRMMGGANFMPLNCIDPDQLMAMAAQGF